MPSLWTSGNWRTARCRARGAACPTPCQPAARAARGEGHWHTEAPGVAPGARCGGGAALLSCVRCPRSMPASCVLEQQGTAPAVKLAFALWKGQAWVPGAGACSAACLDEPHAKCKLGGGGARPLQAAASNRGCGIRTASSGWIGRGAGSRTQHMQPGLAACLLHPLCNATACQPGLAPSPPAQQDAPRTGLAGSVILAAWVRYARCIHGHFQHGGLGLPRTDLACPSHAVAPTWRGMRSSSSE